MVKSTEATIAYLSQAIPEKATKFPDRAELFKRYKRELPVEKILEESAWLTEYFRGKPGDGMCKFKP